MNKLLLVLLLFFLSCVTYASAQGIGVSPDRLDFEVEKGDSAESSFTIFNPGSRKISFSISSETDWLNFYPEKGDIEAGKSVKITAEAAPPETIEAGHYENPVFISFGSNAKSKGIALQAGIGIKADIFVKENNKAANTGKKIKDIKITTAAVAEKMDAGLEIFSRHSIIGYLVTISIVVFGLLAYFGIENLVSNKRWLIWKRKI